MFCIVLSLLFTQNERTYINVGKGAKWSKIISGMIIGLGIAVQCIYSVSKKKPWCLVWEYQKYYGGNEELLTFTEGNAFPGLDLGTSIHTLPYSASLACVRHPWDQWVFSNKSGNQPFDCTIEVFNEFRLFMIQDIPLLLLLMSRV